MSEAETEKLAVIPCITDFGPGEKPDKKVLEAVFKILVKYVRYSEGQYYDVIQRELWGVIQLREWVPEDLEKLVSWLYPLICRKNGRAYVFSVEIDNGCTSFGGDLLHWH